jgi:hypothetical protein
MFALTKSARISAAQRTRYGRSSDVETTGMPPTSAAARLRFSSSLESVPVSWLFVALLACAVAVLVGAEWPRLTGRFGIDARRRRQRARRKASLRLLTPRTESEEFAASVERDLRSLPTIEEHENRS